MSVLPSGKPVRRSTLVAMLRAALESGDYRFARQAALTWLAAFPGDLEVALLQAEGMILEGHAARVIPALETICRRDPFWLDGYRVQAGACRSAERAGTPADSQYNRALTGLFVLGEPIWERERIEPWGEPLRLAYEAYAARQYAEAEALVQETLQYHPDLLLAAALHLLVYRATHETQTVFHLAEIYHGRWPDCLPVSLVLAEMHLKLGSEPEAVQLLHLCAANDSTGQAARRLWGDSHAYQSLWPDDMVILFDQPIPAGVAGRLGWNHLAPGEIHAIEMPGPSQDAAPAESAGVLPGEPNPAAAVPPPATDLSGLPDAASGQPEPADQAATTEPSAGEGPAAADGAVIDALLDLKTEDDGLPMLVVEGKPITGEIDATQAPATGPESSGESGPAPSARLNGRGAPKTDRDGTAHAVEAELNRLAKRLKQPGIARTDGRFPVYVILSSLEGLNAQYGPQTTTVLTNEMRRVAAMIRKRPGWGAMVYFPDDATCTTPYGLTPINARDPWKVKIALCDLDIALRRRGEMIGALLIVGGDPVVPFHRLPNPTGDLDGEVYSDSPYASLDANYFVPEWPVGRLPGENGQDAALLLDQLRSMQRYHGRRKKARPWLGVNWLGWVDLLAERFLPVRGAASFGYTAAAWRRSSLAVFRPIGAPHTVKASPPEDSDSVDREKISLSKLGYYNLHGLEDSPSWYGQRDPLDPDASGPDYPVALSPDELRRNGHAPRVIFSEACYGAHIFGKSERDSLALKFLSMGALAVIGSTCTSYGSVNTPLIAADLLGNLFWQHLKTGHSAGDALMQAKIDLVREMNRRQGFLDGEDQKTLISFVLYGDPMAGCDGLRAHSKAHRMKNHPSVKTIPDRPEESVNLANVDSGVIKQVKQIVAEYLPGAGLDDMHFIRQRMPANAHSKGGAKGPGDTGRMVVTVSKQVQFDEHVHHHYVRVTLDSGGKTVKLSISR